MRYALIIIILFVNNSQIFCQINVSSIAKKEALSMGAALVKADYGIFADYTHPTILKLAGGKEHFQEIMRGVTKKMKQQGLSFKSITVDEPTAVIPYKGEMQCTLEQHSEINASPGRIISTSTLIGVSKNGEKKWTFIDTSGKDIATIRKMFPNLSPAIKIPPPQPPVRYSL